VQPVRQNDLSPVFAAGRPAGRSPRSWRTTFITVFLLPLVASLAFAEDERRSVQLNAIAIGAWSRSDLGIGMLEARAALSPHLLVTAAPTVLSVAGADTEYQFRAAATLLLQLGRVRLDDRNLWVFSDAGTTRYRNRLRLTAPVELSGRALRFQLLDEVFYEQGGRGWFRNLVGVGVGLDVRRSLSADAYWMLLDDDHRPQASMFLLMLTVHVL
jgi:hypothetical protein